VDAGFGYLSQMKGSELTLFAWYVSDFKKSVGELMGLKMIRDNWILH
jgi:hypothetical protein